VRHAAAIATALTVLLAVAVEPALGAAPKPRLGKTVVVKPAGGTVTVKPRGGKLATLRYATAIPVGSTVNTTKGTVLLVTAGKGKVTYSGTFSQGAFVVTQRKKDALTDLTLTGGDFSTCRTGNPQKPLVTGARSRKRRLFGRARGRFRTRGRNSSATVKGTEWTMEDRCDGTLTFDKEGKVATANRDLKYTLEPGQTVQYYCNRYTIKPDTYCVVLLTQAKDGLVGAGIITQTNATSYALCYGAPDGQAECFHFPLSADDAQSFRQSVVVCGVGQVGTFGFSWVVKGVFLFPSLGAKFPATSTFGCISDPPQQPQP
jgi:hypothetical protein